MKLLNFLLFNHSNLLNFVLQSGLTFATGLTVWKSLNKSNKLSSASDNSSNLRRQYDIIKTLVWMELGFTITLRKF